MANPVGCEPALRSQTYCCESTFDRVGDSQVTPALGRTFVELARRVEVVGDLGDRVAILRRIVELEGFYRGLSRVDVFGVADVA